MCLCYPTDRDEPIHPLALRECNSDLVLLSPNNLFSLSVSAIDYTGMFTTFDSVPDILFNTSTTKVDSSKIQEQFSKNPGLLPSTLEFQVEILQNETDVPVTVVAGGKSRTLKLRYDNQPPRIKNQKRNVTASTYEGDFTCEIRFRDEVFWSVGTGCDPVVGNYIQSDMDFQGNGHTSSGAETTRMSIYGALGASDVCSRAISESRNLRPEHFIVVNSSVDPASVSGELSEDRRVLKIYGQLNKRRSNGRKVDGLVDPGEKVEIVVLSSTLMDSAGNQLLTNATYNGTVYRRPKEGGVSGVGEVSSKTMLAASAVVATSSLTDKVGIGGSPGIGPVMELISLGQKIYFMGVIAGNEMPENFRRVSKAFAWCALNVRLLWETPKSEITNEDGSASDGAEFLGNTVDVAETVEMLSYNNEIDPYLGLARVAFLTCILHLALLIFRPLGMVLVRRFSLQTPTLLVFPRLELFLAFWTIPAISAAAARLLTHSSSGLILGIGVLLLGPCCFLIFLAVILYVAFFKKEPEAWRVRMVSYNNPTNSQPPSAQSVLSFVQPNTSIELGQADDQMAETSCTEQPADARGALPYTQSPETVPSKIYGQSKISLTAAASIATEPPNTQPSRSPLVRALVGCTIEKTKWIPQQDQDKFLQRFGPLFEDLRVPLTQQNLTQSPGSAVSFLSRRGSKLEAITLLTAWLDCLKRIIIAMICVVDLDVLHLEQLIFVTCLSFAFVIYLRVFRPYRSQWRLGLIMIIELTDCFTFAMGALAVAAGSERAELQKRCGLVMLCTQGAAYCLMLSEKLVPAFSRAGRLINNTAQGFRLVGRE